MENTKTNYFSYESYVETKGRPHIETCDGDELFERISKSANELPFKISDLEISSAKLVVSMIESSMLFAQISIKSSSIVGRIAYHNYKDKMDKAMKTKWSWLANYRAKKALKLYDIFKVSFFDCKQAKASLQRLSKRRIECEKKINKHIKKCLNEQD